MGIQKFIFKYLMALTSLVVIVIYIITAKYEIEDQVNTKLADNLFKQDGSQLVETKDKLEVSQIVNTNVKYPLDRMYKVGDEKANVFSVSYSYEETGLEVGSTLKSKSDDDKYGSDQLYFLFRETYPNISLEEMGLETPEEAYMAVQLAVWEIAGRTGEAKYYTELSKIDSIKEEVGNKNTSLKVFKKAKELVTFVENYSRDGNEDITLVPTLIMHNADIRKDIIKIYNELLVGPYSYSLSSGILKDVNIDITDGEGNNVSGKVTDANGFEIKDIQPNTNFYIRFPSTYKEIKFNTKVDVRRLTPAFYENDGFDYIVNSYTDIDIQKELSIKIDS